MFLGNIYLSINQSADKNRVVITKKAKGTVPSPNSCLDLQKIEERVRIRIDYD